VLRREGKEPGLSSLSPGMRPMPLGWFLVAVWAVVCVLIALAIAIMAVTVLS
jgi:hypothetical protein